MKSALFYLLFVPITLAAQQQNFDPLFFRYEQQSKQTNEPAWTTEAFITQEMDINGRLATQNVSGAPHISPELGAFDSVHHYYSLGSKDSVEFYRDDFFVGMVLAKVIVNEPIQAGLLEQHYRFPNNAVREHHYSYQEINRGDGQLNKKSFTYYDSNGGVESVDRYRYLYDSASRSIGVIDSVFMASTNDWTVRSRQRLSYNFDGQLDSTISWFESQPAEERVTVHDYDFNGTLVSQTTYIQTGFSVTPDFRKDYIQHQNNVVAYFETYRYDDFLNDWFKQAGVALVYDTKGRLISETWDNRSPMEDVRYTYAYDYPTRIEERSESMLVTVYPNPITDRVTISAASVFTFIEILDDAGRFLSRHNTHSKEVELQLGHLSSGTYFMRLTTENGSRTVPLVKH